jgi:ferritin-like metal-binding protein YciE
MALLTLEDLFVEEMKDVLGAEKQLLKALPKMAKSATAAPLKKAFESHLRETKGQVTRLEKAFELLGKSPRSKKCKAMEGLLHEGSELMKKEAEEPVLDAALIAAAQKVEHYEIATYGTLIAWARELGQRGVVDLLKATLAEEEAADKKLTKIAANRNEAADAKPSNGARRKNKGFLTSISEAVGLN